MLQAQHQPSDPTPRSKMITVQVPVWMDDEVLSRLIGHAVTEYILEIKKVMGEGAFLVGEAGQA